MHPLPIPIWSTTAEAEALLAPLLEIPAAKALRRAAAGRDLHLVGGTLRDRLLGRPHRDVDAVVAGAGSAVAERLATLLGARLVPLGHDALVSHRVAQPDLVIDLWDRGEVSLELDLARRDVSINAMALDLVSGRLSDPVGGLADLAAGRLRVPSSQVLDDDPLRVLRLVRLSAELAGFRPTDETLAAARVRVGRLLEVAGERVRHELELALEVVPALPTFELLGALGVHPGFLLGDLHQGEPAAALAAGHQAFARSDALLAARAPTARSVRRLVLHWLLLLSAVPASVVPDALGRLRRLGYMGRRTARDVTAACGRLELPQGPAEQRWFLHRFGDLWPTVAMAAEGLTGERTLEASRERLLLLDELERLEGDRLFDPPPLLPTARVMALTGLASGPELGRLLDRLRRLQIAGALATAEDASRWLKDL